MYNLLFFSIFELLIENCKSKENKIKTKKPRGVVLLGMIHWFEICPSLFPAWPASDLYSFENNKNSYLKLKTADYLKNLGLNRKKPHEQKMFASPILHITANFQVNQTTDKKCFFFLEDDPLNQLDQNRYIH